VRSIRISKGIITITYLDRRYGQPMSARPTVPVTWRYKLADEKLVALSPLTNADLNNATYPIESYIMPFTNGKYKDDAKQITAQILAKPRAAGDLNGDGSPDSAVIISANYGGSGVFVYLSPVINESNIAKPLTGVLLGDRIRVTGLTIRNGLVTVTTLERKPDEPMTAKPSVVTRSTYKLEGDQLVAVKP
jgi:hypothetical protein